MPKLKKEEVIAKLKELNVEFDENESYNNLFNLLKETETPKEEALEAGKVERIGEEGETTPPEEKKEEKRNPFASFETKLPMTGKAHEMRKKLMNQPKVPAFIPLGNDELVGSTHQVTLNGYTMFIRKGMTVQVPLQVKEILDEKFKVEMDVRQHPLKVKNMKDINLQQFD